jgi:hypothetical protein
MHGPETKIETEVKSFYNKPNQQTWFVIKNKKDFGHGNRAAHAHSFLTSILSLE